MKRTQQSARFDPARLLDVETLDQIRRVPADFEGLFVRRLNDEKLAAIAAYGPRRLQTCIETETITSRRTRATCGG